MNAIAALIVLAALGGPAEPGRGQAMQGQAMQGQMMQGQARLMLAQASTPPPGTPPSGPMSPPNVGAPAPTPKIDSLPEGPPLGSLSLSQLMLKIEGEPEFAYVSAVDWRDGKYAITYITRDGQPHEKAVDPRTGRASSTGGQNGTPSNAPTTAPRPAGPRQ